MKRTMLRSLINSWSILSTIQPLSTGSPPENPLKYVRGGRMVWEYVDSAIPSLPRTNVLQSIQSSPLSKRTRRFICHTHCLPLLRKFNYHINIEVTGCGHLFQYLFKYIHKGIFESVLPKPELTQSHCRSQSRKVLCPIRGWQWCWKGTSRWDQGVLDWLLSNCRWASGNV